MSLSDSSSCAGVEHDVEGDLLDILRVGEVFSYTMASPVCYGYEVVISINYGRVKKSKLLKKGVANLIST